MKIKLLLGRFLTFIKKVKGRIRLPSHSIRTQQTVSYESLKEASLTWNLPGLLFPTSLPTESASAASEVLSLQCLTRAAQGN